MIYLDHGATTLHKPDSVRQAVSWAINNCGNPGRGGHPASICAGEAVFRCREQAGKLFCISPERVVFTSNCTHGLNIAINTLVKPGSRVVISGFEHNAVTRPLYALKAQITIAGRRLFDQEDTLQEFEAALRRGQDAAVFTHVSNVFGYILPVEKMAALCRQYQVPFILDAAQSAGSIEINMETLGADFIAMPGHKGLLGPQGTGLLLCGAEPAPLLFGGTGSVSRQQKMPDFLPDRLEAGTVNVPGICGLCAGMEYVAKTGLQKIARREMQAKSAAVRGLQKLGYQVFAGENQSGVLSFLHPDWDCEELAEAFAKLGIAMRAGLHCAPIAHESAGTLETGTVRASFGNDATIQQANALVQTADRIRFHRKK